MSRPTTLVYIAGPFSPTPIQKTLIAASDVPQSEAQHARRFTEDNILRAAKLGVKVAKLGAYPIVPHANTALPEYEDVQPYPFWIGATAEILRRCDAVLFTDDWQESAGARGENELAIDAGIPRFFSLSDLAEWLLPEVARLNSTQPAPVLDTEQSPAPTMPPDSFYPPIDHHHLPKLSDLPADLAAQFPSPYELASVSGRAVE